MARLDALGPVKELAQMGAVLGREFSHDLLLKVSPMKERELQEPLAVAVREELFYQRGTPPEATYLFKHTLIRDAAYQSLLRSTRQRHHRRVAETLIDRMPQVAESQPELVAHHLTEAGEAERAIEYWHRAGGQANERAAHEEAIKHLRRGLSLLALLATELARDRWELELQFALASALVAVRGYGHPETGEAWERAEALCDVATDAVRRGSISSYVATFHASRGDPRGGIPHELRALDIGERHGHDLLTIAAYNGCGYMNLLLGDLLSSRGYLDRANSLYDPSRHRFFELGFVEETGVAALCWAQWNYWHLGYADHAWELAERALEITEDGLRPFTKAWALVWGSMTALSRGDWGRTRHLAAEGACLAGEQGFALLEGLGLFIEACGAGLSGEDATALDRCDAGMAKVSGTGNRAGAPWMLDRVAELQLRAGRPREAMATIDGGLTIARDTSQHFRDAELHRLKGEVFLQIPDHTEDEAEALFRNAIEVAQGQEAKSLELRAVTSLARLWHKQGKKDEARALLAPVYDWFTEGFDTQDLKDARALMVELGA
jgi:tetratricopeptide (TPR) repeat protein